MGCFFVFIGDVVKAHLGDDFSGENVSNDDDSGYVLDAIVTTYDGSSADHVHRDTDSGMGADTTRLSVAINTTMEKPMLEHPQTSCPGFRSPHSSPRRRAAQFSF